MTNTDHYVSWARILDPLREPVVHSAIQALQIAPDIRCLDAGCGIGLQTLMLAEKVGPAGHITGLDLSPKLLAHARRIVEDSGMSERITFKEGNISDLPFEDDSFDLAWSMDCVGYLPLQPVPLLAELSRVVRPGGRVAILAWSSERLLPGYPLLEARLNGTSAGIAPFVLGNEPETHFMRGLGWFRESGLEEARAQTFVGSAYAPLPDDLRRALGALLQMRWQGVEKELNQGEWEAYQRLIMPESPDYVLDEPAYYAFFTYSMFSGVVKAYPVS